MTGVILAGGRGNRMGGADKGWIEFRGKPLIEHVIERFAPQVDQLIISANRSLERYRALGYAVVEDEIGDFAGPLAGLHASMRVAAAEWIATVPCDGPLFPRDFVQTLLAASFAHGADVAVVRAGGRVHPVYAVCRRRCDVSLKAYLHAGGRRQLEWVESQKHLVVDFSDATAFRNLNAPDDLISQ